MVTSKIQKTHSRAQCEHERTETLKGLLEIGQFDALYSVCLPELPLRLMDASEGKRSRWNVVIQYIDDSIETVEIFSEVDRTLTDAAACMKLTAMYQQIDPKVICNAYLEERGNHYLDRFGSGYGSPPARLADSQTSILQDPKPDIDGYPTRVPSLMVRTDTSSETPTTSGLPLLGESETEPTQSTGNYYLDKYGNQEYTLRETPKDEAAELLKIEQEESAARASKYWSSISDSVADCRIRNPSLNLLNCWEKSLPKKCASLAYLLTLRDRSKGNPAAMCARSCIDAGFFHGILENAIVNTVLVDLTQLLIGYRSTACYVQSLSGSHNWFRARRLSADV